MARLAARVYVDGRWWGPDDEVPAETAAKVTNRAAWADAPTSTRSAATQPEPRRESVAQESRSSRESGSQESGSQESRSSGRRRRAD